MSTEVAFQALTTLGNSKRTNAADVVCRKLPRPIAVWSLNEKTAYRRNRVMQTRLTTIMDNIAVQQETSRKTLRYEAHKFRKKNAKYYCHPSACVDTTSAVNIAPLNWKPSLGFHTEPINEQESSSDIENEEDNEFSIVEESPRKKGIITRVRTPTVKFTMVEQEYQIEEDLQIADFDAASLTDEKNIKTVERMGTKVRSLSAVQTRENLSCCKQQGLRQQSAFPALRNQPAIELKTDDSSNKSTSQHSVKAKSTKEFEKRTQCFDQEYRSSNFFDKSKAAYMLRQDLRRRAKMRKQSIKPFVFTVKDALNLEKEKFLKTRENVADYIKRIERIKCDEREAINKWTRNEMFVI